MEVIQKKIYFIPPKSVTFVNTGFTNTSNSGNLSSSPNLNNVIGLIGFATSSNSTFNIPILLTHTMEDIGIYSDYTALVTKDVDSVLNGSQLTLEQISYLTGNSADCLLYVNNKKSEDDYNTIYPPFPTGRPKSIADDTRDWWDFIGKNDTSNNAIRKEVLISLSFKVNSSQLQVINTATTITQILGHSYSNNTTAAWEGGKDGYVNYFTNPLNLITGVTKNRLNEVRTSDPNAPFTVGINNVIIINNAFTGYSINNITYITFSGSNLNTIFSILSSGFTQSNISLDFIVKEDMLTGVVFPPKVENNVNIDRQHTSVLDPFYRLQQIDTVDQFTSYDNGYYAVDNQSISVKFQI